MIWDSRKRVLVVAGTLFLAFCRIAVAAETSVTIVGLEAKGGIDATVADAATDDLSYGIETAGIPVASSDSMKAELKRRGLSQTCGVDDCPLPFDQILKSTHFLRGSISQLGTTRILKVTLETVKPRKPVFSGRREFDASDAGTLAAVKDLARDVVECLQGKNCTDEPWGGGEAPMPSMPGVAAGGGNYGVAGKAAPVTATTYGVLRVNSRPAGAEVYVDGDLKGTTPLTMPKIEAGDRTVIIHAEGFADLTKMVSVQANGTSDVSEALAELTGKLEILTTPTDAQVFIDDKYVGQSPYKVSALRVGSYRVMLKHENYADDSLKITVEANRTARVDETLKGLPGKIVVTTTPSGAKVYVDGTETGKSLWSGSAEAGTHKVGVSLDGYQDGEKELEVKPGGSATATFTLEEAPKGYVATGGGAPGGMVMIPAGKFLYGDEKKSINLPAFQIDKTEVTTGAYAKCVQSGKCSKPYTTDSCTFGGLGKEDYPINCVSWGAAKTYCEWVGKRLPTEQEWEKAARGTDGRTYPWGEQEPTCDKTIMDQEGLGCGNNGTWSVCSKANGNSPYGICDMAGNVWEWTSDLYDREHDLRVLRGGSWNFDNAAGFRAAARYYYDPTYRYSNIGFRCAK